MFNFLNALLSFDLRFSLVKVMYSIFSILMYSNANKESLENFIKLLWLYVMELWLFLLPLLKFSPFGVPILHGTTPTLPFEKKNLSFFLV